MPSIEPPRNRTVFLVGWGLIAAGFGALVVLLINAASFSATATWVTIIFIAALVGSGGYVTKLADRKPQRRKVTSRRQ